MAENAARWLDDADFDPQLLVPLQKAVDYVIEHYQGDAKVFSDGNALLQKHLSDQVRKAELLEKRHTEAAKRREKLEIAKLRANEILEAVVGEARLPKFTRALLNQAWADVLTLTLLRHDESSDEWNKQLEATRSIVATCARDEPGDDPVNNLFEHITRLDQQQRADAIRNPGKSYRAILQESKQLTATLDSLIAMPWNNTRQPTRLEAMKRVVAKRVYLLLEYLRLRSEFISNKKFTQQLDSLSLILSVVNPQSDSTVTTSQNKTTTTTYLPEEKKRNFFSRLFGGKKKDSVDARVEVKEETLTRIDTLAVGRQEGSREEVERIMKRLDEDQRLQTSEMLET